MPMVLLGLLRWGARLLPGQETNDRAALDPRFRAKVERVLSALQKEGFRPRLVSSYRSARRQNAYCTLGRISQKLGSGPWTQARGLHSCHNARTPDGPASLAADVVPTAHTASEKARFYWALGRAAERQGLRWGGRWRQTNKLWARFGLGWDPAHIQSRRCYAVLKKLRAKAGQPAP